MFRCICTSPPVSIQLEKNEATQYSAPAPTPAVLRVILVVLEGLLYEVTLKARHHLGRHRRNRVKAESAACQSMPSLEQVLFSLSQHFGPISNFKSN